MRLDGIPEPHTIVIQLPLSVLDHLTEQYMATGLEITEATEAATRSIERRILQYLPAGAPYIVIDENRNYYPGLSIRGAVLADIPPV